MNEPSLTSNSQSFVNRRTAPFDLCYARIILVFFRSRFGSSLLSNAGVFSFISNPDNQYPYQVSVPICQLSIVLEIIGHWTALLLMHFLSAKIFLQRQSFLSNSCLVFPLNFSFLCFIFPNLVFIYSTICLFMHNEK